MDPGSEDFSTVGLTAAELDRLLSAAEARGARSAALVSLLVYNGLRIAELLASEISSHTAFIAKSSKGSLAMLVSLPVRMRSSTRAWPR